MSDIKTFQLQLAVASEFANEEYTKQVTKVLVCYFNDKAKEYGCSNTVEKEDLVLTPVSSDRVDGWATYVIHHKDLVISA